MKPKIKSELKYEIDGKTCYLFDMDHPGWSSKLTLKDLFDRYLNEYNWKKFIHRGDTVIDIGAHNGDTTVPMQFLSGGTILGIEPNPILKQYLDMAVELNKHLPGRIIVADEAVTTEDVTSVEILDHNNALCNGGLIDPSWTPALQAKMRATAGGSFCVPGMTLEHICDKYLNEEEISKIGFIKTDTEGHDKSILESSANLIERTRPIIFTEWFFAYTIDESRELFRVINELGYNAYYPSTLQQASINVHSEDLVLIHRSKLKYYF